MAYGLKYELLCTSKKSNAYSARIKELDYAGADIDRNIPINSFILRKDKAAVIHGTSFEFSMREEVDFEYIPFYTSIPKKYLVEVYNSLTAIWSGYINTQQYNALYKPVPNTISFMASDGLGLLKNEAFTLTGIQDQFAVIRHCIDKIGLNLNYAIAINIYEVNHDTSRSPLEQTEVNCSIFTGKNCYEVIEMVLGRYDAEITQVENRWKIVSSIDKESSLLIYDYAGVYDSTVQAGDLLFLDYPANSGDCWPAGSPLIHSLQPGGNRVKITQNYGLKKSMLSNYDFSKITEGVFDSWTATDPFNTMDVYQKLYNGKYYVYLDGNLNSTNAAYLNQLLAVDNITGQEFNFEVDVCPVGSGVNYSSINMTVKMMVKLHVGATDHYLTTTGWTTTPSYISVVAPSVPFPNSVPSWTKVKIITDEIPGSGTMFVYLQQYHTDGGGDSYRGVLFLEPCCYFTTDGALYTDKFEETAVFDNSSELVPLTDVILAAGDAPGEGNDELIFNNILLLSDGTPTTGWNLPGNDTSYSFLEIYLKLLASRNRCPRQVLKGVLKGAGRLTIDSIIQHTYNSNRKFEIVECQWDMYEESFNATLLELLPFSDEDITLTNSKVLHSTANLTVASVSPGTNPVAKNTSFNVTVHIDNSGEMPGRNIIQWKIVDAEDATISSGTHISQVIAAFSHNDDTFSLTSPNADGSYYVKCKIITDTSWVSSAALLVGSDLDVITVTPSSYTLAPEAAFNSTIHIHNVGADSGSGTIEWEVLNEDNEADSWGTHSSGVIAAAGNEDHVINMTAPPTPGTYYVKAKMTTDSSWISSGAITVALPVNVALDHVDTISTGFLDDPMTVSFQATNSGGAGTDRVYWQIRNSAHSVLTSGFENINFSAGTATYNLTDITYPGPGGTNYDLQIGLSAGTMDQTSNHFGVTT